MPKLLCVVFCSLACLASPALAQDSKQPSQPEKPAKKPGKPAAYTDASEAGVDFDLQGEYAGLVSGGYRRKRKVWQR